MVLLMKDLTTVGWSL